MGRSIAPRMPFCVILLFLVGTRSPGADLTLAPDGPRLRVRPGATYLESTDGKPFFWLADTVWSGPAVATLNDWNTYLADRRAKHFTVVQFNAVCPWRVNQADAAGEPAYTGRDPIAINEKYFARLDKYYDAIERNGLVAAPVLLWANTKGDAGTELSEDDAVRLARYQVQRYGKRNVVWILAGDNRYTADLSARWQRIGRRVFADFPDAVATTHPTGMNWPWDEHGWREEKWLSFLGYQSGHGDGNKTFAWLTSGSVAKAWKIEPVKPIINLEPPYEDHLAYQSKRPHDAHSVRRATYWSLLVTPTAGVTYGGHGIWSWETERGRTPAAHGGTGVANPWFEAKDLPGAADVGRAAQLFQSIEWWRLRPAPGLLLNQPGEHEPAKFIAVAATGDRDTVVAYLPEGGEIVFDAAKLKVMRLEAFNPRTGERTAIAAREPGRFALPSGEDWVLVASP